MSSDIVMYKGNFVQTVCWQTRPLAVSNQARGGEQTFHRYWCSRSWQISASHIFSADIRLTKIRRLSRISAAAGGSNRNQVTERSFTKFGEESVSSKSWLDKRGVWLEVYCVCKYDNNNSKTMFMVLSSWQSHCESSPGETQSKA